jgi:hypothetical protein
LSDCELPFDVDNDDNDDSDDDHGIDTPSAQVLDQHDMESRPEEENTELMIEPGGSTLNSVETTS